MKTKTKPAPHSGLYRCECGTIVAAARGEPLRACGKCGGGEWVIHVRADTDGEGGEHEHGSE